MGIFKKLIGTIESSFALGILGNRIANDADGLAVRNNADSAYENLRIARPSTAGSNNNEMASAYLDVKERVVLIEFSFDGATPPGAGTNTGKYGFVHTTGGTYTAGQIVYDDGATLTVIPMYKMMLLSSSGTVSGTISLISNGVYQLTSVPPTYTWILKGDGTATGVGLVQLIEVSFGSGDMGTDVDSTTVIPDGARVLRTGIRVDTPFSGGAAPAAEVKVNGSSPVTILATGESRLQAADQYENDGYVDIGATATGVVRVTLTGTATAGAGVAFVEYATPFV